MGLSSWLRNNKNRTRRFRPQLEALEDRWLPSFLAPVNYAAGSYSQAGVTADLNADGKLDLVTAGYGSVSVLLGNGNGTFAAAKSYAAVVGGDTSAPVAVGDFNGDHKLDLVTCGSLLIGNGDGTFKTAVATRAGSGPVAAGDFNGDGKLDFATTTNGGDWGTTYLQVWQTNGKKNLALTAGGAYHLPQYSGNPSGMAASDLNGDHYSDLIVTGDAGWGSGYVTVLLGGKYGLQEAQGYGYYGWSVPSAVAAGDVNGDGKPDIVTADPDGTVTVFGRSWAVGTSLSANAVAFGDFNGDGNQDIVSANSDGTVSLLLGNGDGTFAAALRYSAVASYGSSVALGDFNGDGKPDLAVTDSYNSTVGVILNAADWATTTHFVVSGFPSATAGVAGSFTVTAQKSNGSTDTGYTGTVHFVSTDYQDSVPADYTFTAADKGTHTFTTTLTRAGNVRLWATDTQARVAPGAEIIAVQAAAAASLGVNVFPYSADYGTTGSGTVGAWDAYGNLATSYNGTVHFTSSDPLAVLPADAVVTNGVSQTVSVTLKTAGRQSITATDIANPTITGSEQYIEVRPIAHVIGPGVAVEGKPVTFTLQASGAPAGAICTFYLDWFDGTTQTVTGPSGTTVTHTYNNLGYWQITMTASVAGASSQATYDYVGMQDIPISVQADPAVPGKQILVVDGSYTSNWIVSGGFVLEGYLNLTLSDAPGNGVTVILDGNSLGTYTTSDGSPFATVIVLGCQNGNTIDARGLSVSTVLVGGFSGDSLYGGSGRNLLIGNMYDTLYAGSAGDILIGGTTSYDHNPTALAFIMAEWNRTDVDYATRVGHLNGSISGGWNGTYLLNSKTVLDDATSDVLNGGAGLDWFFAHLGSLNLDQVNGKTSGEVVTSI